MEMAVVILNSLTEFTNMGAYHLARKSENFGLKSNGKVIFRKFRSEIVEYLQRYSSFSVRNGTTEISLPFAKLSDFQSLISRKQLREIEVQMVKRHFIRLVCRFWKNPYHCSTIVPTGLFWQIMVSTLRQRWSRIFRSEKTETDLSIWIPIAMSGIFGIIESTPNFWVLPNPNSHLANQKPWFFTDLVYLKNTSSN